MGENVTFQCSPRTFALVQQDPNLLNQFLDHGSISAQPEDGDFDSIECGNDTPCPPEKNVWVGPATTMMLSLLGELRPKVGKSVKLKTKQKMWKTIEEEMKKSGYNFTALQIENKYRGMERSFKSVKSHNNKTGRNRKTCSYEKELSEILTERPSVFPTFIAGTSRSEVLRKEDFLNAAQEESNPPRGIEESTSVSSLDVGVNFSSDIQLSATPTSSKKRSKQEEIINELKLLREERQKQHEDIMEALRQSSERKEKIMTERNDILRSIAESLKK